MKKNSLCVVLLLFLFPLLGLMNIQSHAHAQADSLKVNVNVFMELNGEEPIPQEIISFDIIHYPNPGSEGQVYYSYRSDNPANHTDLYLPEGEYKFRLFDGGGFVRNGAPIMGKAISLTSPNFNFDESIFEESSPSLVSQGEVIDWGNGQSVFDFMFNVELASQFFVLETNQYEGNLNIVLADEVSMNQRINQESVSNSNGNNVTLQVKAIDSFTQDGIGNVNIQVNELQGITDESGVYQVILPNQESYSVIADAPPGYEFQSEGNQTVEVINGEALVEFIFTPIEPSESTELSKGSLIFKVLDEEGNPLEGITVNLGDHSLSTQANGQGVFEQIETGNYTYSIQVPEGYQSVEPQNIVVSENERLEKTIELEKEPVYEDLEIQLVTEDGQPIVGAIIEMFAREYSTNAEGKLILEEVPANQAHKFTVSNIPETIGEFEEIGEQEVFVSINQVNQHKVVVKTPEKTGELEILVADSKGQVFSGLELKVGDQSAMTDAQGIARFNSLPVGMTQYELINLPEGFQGETEGVVYIYEDELATLTIYLEEDVQYGTVTFKIIDQDENPVHPASLEFNQREFATNNQGEVIILDVVADETYNYQLRTLPDNYVGEVAGSIDVLEGENEVKVIEVQKEIAPASLTIQVVDQDQQVVEGVSLSINNQEAQTTNALGQIELTNLEPGNYQYKLTAVPDTYKMSEEEKSIYLDEGDSIRQKIIIQREIAQGHLELSFKDQEGQVVENVRVRMKGQEQVSDDNGSIAFKELDPGVYELNIVSLPEDYQIQNRNFQITITEGEVSSELIQLEKTEVTTEVTSVLETTTQELTTLDETSIETTTQETTTQETTTQETITQEITSLESTSQELTSLESTNQEKTSSETTSNASTSEESNVSVSTSDLRIEPHNNLTAEEESRIEAEARQATRQFVDSETGISVFINPSDAENVIKVEVEKINNSNLLDEYDADLYEIKLIDRNNQLVQPTHIAEVKLPTRPISSQLQVVKVSNQQASSLIFGLHNQKATFRTQELGTFGIVYGNKESSQKDQRVVEETTEEKKLPVTGESNTILITILAVLILVLGIFILRKKK